MADTIIPLHCPKCGERSMQFTGDLDLDKPFTCGKCGANVHVRELKTPAGISILDHSTNIARDAFKGIKGFKPKR